MRYVVLQFVMLAALLAAAASGAGPSLTDSDLLPPRLARMMAVAGTAAMLTAGALALWAFASLGRSLAATPAPRSSARFVARGPYRWMRHPMYSSLLLLALGVVLRRPSLFALLAFAGLTVALLLKVRREESLLLARYPEYAAYRARTWGLLALPLARHCAGERGPWRGRA